jgi:ribose transport system ATP-binding protein
VSAAADSLSVLEACQITKAFPGIVALDNVNLSLRPSEVLAVIGENGAGKSTLMKALAGVERPDAGTVRMEGRPVAFDSVRQALHHGVALIHQELNLSDNLNIAGNIFLGREPHRFGLLKHRQLVAQAEPYLRQVGLLCSASTPVSTLSIAQQQMVEIAKALSCRARVLIMDEPTSSLTAHESEQLFGVIRRLRSEGVSVIYISHRLTEVSAIADRVVVLRDGRNAGELQAAEITHDRMVRLMVGRDLAQFYQRRSRPIGAPMLEVEKLRTSAHPGHAINCQVRAGEIVGVAGLIGAGRSELLQTLFGIHPAVAGTVRLAGQAVRLDSPLAAIRAGLALLPEDRKQQGLILEFAIRANVALPSLCACAAVESGAGVRRGFLVRRDVEERLSAEMVRRLNIKTPHDLRPAENLSGGNQQKVVLAKWLTLRPRVLLLDEPTRGVDIGAKREIYTLIEQLAEAGIAVLFVSSELPEIIGMSDRVLVMHQGALQGELSGEAVTEQAIMHLATGGQS